MKNFKEEIKNWLKRIGKDRLWLATNTYVSKATVDGWLSSRGHIPQAKIHIINELMKMTEDVFTSHGDTRENWKSFAVLLSTGDYQLIEKAAQLDEMPVEEWSEKKLIEDAMNRTRNSGKQSRDAKAYEYMAADEPKVYGSKPDDRQQ